MQRVWRADGGGIEVEWPRPDNALTAPMAVTDAAVLAAVASALLAPEVVERAIVLAEAAFHAATDPDAQRRTLLATIAKEEATGRRLAEAIGAGEVMEPLLVALKASKQWRVAGKTALATLRERVVASSVTMRKRLYGYLADWQATLSGNPVQGGIALRRLIRGQLAMEPRGNWYAFRGEGTIKPVLEGVVARDNLASPAGLPAAYARRQLVPVRGVLAA